MKAFLLEVLAAMKEGPRLYFAPVVGAIKAAASRATPSTRRPMK
jgi:hypothetical protein